MNILTEKFLAIEEGWLANYANLLNTNAILPSAEKPEVKLQSAENSYSRNDLEYYFGLKTEMYKGKLVVVVPFEGAMSSSWWGGVNTKWIATQLQVAAGNTNVAAIVLDMNSPGGTVEGTARLGKVIKKIEKPVLTAVSMLGASAALVPAAACRETWIASETTSGMGSLGVIYTHISIAKKMAAENYEVAVLRSKGSEDKALLNQYEPIDKNALAEMQQVVDAMRVEMLADIRSGRPKVSPDVTGKMFYGRDAIRAGFADYVGDLDAVIKRGFYLGLK